VSNFGKDELIGSQVGLYIVRPLNLNGTFQNRNYFRAGIGGSKEHTLIDRSSTASGKAQKSSSLHSRLAMHFASWITGGEIISLLVLPRSVINKPSGPTMLRILEQRREGDARPDYALKGMTQGRALEKVMHNELDQMPKIQRARTDRVEWFQTQQADFRNAKEGQRMVGQGVWYDLTKHNRFAMPADLIGKGTKLTGGVALDVTSHSLRKSSRLLSHTQDEIVEDDGTVSLTLQDIEEVRSGTPRGQLILETITRRQPKEKSTQVQQTETATAGVQVTPRRATRSTVTQATTPPPPQTPDPIKIHLTRTQTKALREAAVTPDDAKKRKRILAALQKLATT